MLQIATQIPRVFEFTNKGQKIELSDIDPTMSPEAVINFYGNTYPELLTAKIEGPTIGGDKVIYKLSSVMGTKG